MFIYLTLPDCGCGMWFPDQGSNLGALQWESGVLGTGPSGKNLLLFLAASVFVVEDGLCQFGEDLSAVAGNICAVVGPRSDFC